MFDGLHIVDPIEGAQCSILTPTAVDPTPSDTDEFYFPVDTAAAVYTGMIELPTMPDVFVRDSEGTLVEHVKEEAVSVPPGQYNLEVTVPHMKLYLLVDGAVTVGSHDEQRRLTFEETTRVVLGARSLHEQPAATVTIPETPEGVMAGLSTFGSALKTTSCERSFPTLQGHPPLLEFGSELSVPDTIETPDTGITIEVPPEYEYVYPVTSLSYYLGATVEPGAEPRLLAGTESFSLTADGDFETTVARVFKQLFLLDCVVRTEGYYKVDLHQRRLVEANVDIDCADLYGRSLVEQVQRYLDIPYAAVADAVQRWKLTADIVARPAHAKTLPYLASDLALVRCPCPREIESRSIHSGSTTVADYFGSSSETARGLTRSQHSEAETPFSEPVFRPPETDSIEQTYVGEGIPLGAGKMTVEAFERRLEHEPSENARIDIVVVCNDEEMADENVVSDIYGTREWIDFDITVEQSLTVEEMAEVLTTDADFLHYIGHVDEEGIRCADGWLDTNTLDGVSVDSFLLNACQSYEQGQGLVDNGAYGGIVTVTDVLNKTATKLGRTIARFLDSGYSLLSALELLQEESIVASNYLVVGDGNVLVVQNRSGAATFVIVEAIDADSVTFRLVSYPSKKHSLGVFSQPRLPDESRSFLIPGELDSFTVSKDAFARYLDLQSSPVRVDGGLVWSFEYSVD